MILRELTPSLWPALEELFGPRGACGGCWCMAWRVEKGEQWDDLKGAPAKRRLKTLVTRDEAHGMLAFAPDEHGRERPIGWCAFGPRTDFAKLARARTLACDDAADVWSIPCFFIRREFRRQGVGRALLDEALRAIARHGGRIAEGYPVKDGANLVDVFSWTGTTSMFRRAGFRPVGPRGGGKQRMRRSTT